MRKYTTLKVEREASVDWLTLDRPAKMNAINQDMVRELCAYFSDAQHDYDCRVIVLRGAGRGFCAGLDLSIFDDDQDSLSIGAENSPSLSALVLKMRSCPQPIVSLIHGAACGGGFTLALASDIRLASRSARMNVAFVNLGLSGCELGTSYFLPRMVGPTVAAELMMTGRFIHADRALARGLVSEVVDDGELENAARTLLRDMLALTPIGLRKTKQTMEIAKKLDDLAAVIPLEEHTQTLCMQDPGFEAAVAALAVRTPSSPLDKTG